MTLYVAFTLASGGTALLVLTLLVTLLVEDVQIWPPPGSESWQYQLTWTCFGLHFAGLLVVGALDQGSLGLSAWLGDAGHVLLGSVLFASGTGIASYAMGYLGRREMLGLEGELATDGPYAISRNPGYVGDVMLVVGYSVLTDSFLAAVVASGGVAWYLLAPLAEEPWLEATYGQEYVQYRAQHPRFFPLSSLTS